MYNFELQQPTHIVSLATSAVLVSIDVNVWSATKQDRGISDEITTAKKAQSASGRFVKHLFADNPKHKRIVNQRQTIYNWLKRNTFRWNNAQDLLPVVQLEKFKTEFAEHETEFERLVDDFLTNYKGLVSDMAFTHGDMFNATDYPSVDEVRNKFGIRLYVSEVPEQDFRCQVAQDLANDLRNQYQRQAEEIVNNVVSQQIERITDVMESISHCCGTHEITTKTGEITTKKRKIYDSTIEKAKDLVKSCKHFKPLKNEQADKLNQAVLSLENVLNGVSTELLRDSDAVRDKVKSDVDDILSKFQF